MMPVCTIFLSIYAVMTRALGIVPQMLNLDAIKQQPQQTFTDDNNNINGENGGIRHNAAGITRPQDLHHQRHRKRWQAVSITICIAFACGYPYAITKLLQNPTNGKKGVNYFITYIYYGAKYIVTLIIYFVQFRNDQQFQYIQMLSQTMYGQICCIARIQQQQQGNGQRRAPFLIGFRFDPRDRLSINAWNVGNFCKTMAMIAGYLFVNYLKLIHIFHNPRTMTIFDLFCYYYPNVFICLYVTQFYIGIQQQVYIFNEINTILSDFVEELNFFGVQMDGTKNATAIIHVLAANNADGASIDDSENKKHANRQNGGILHLPIAVDKLNELIFVHDALRYINNCLERMHSLQIIFIIVNAFMNIVSEVFIAVGEAMYMIETINSFNNFQLYFVYSDIFIIPHPDSSVTLFTFVQAIFYAIELYLIFIPCNALRNKVK